MTRLIRGLVLLGTLGSACSSQMVGDAGTGGHAGALGQTGGDAGTGGYAGALGQTSGDAGTGGCSFVSGPAASWPLCSEIPQEVASRQTVTVLVRNDTNQDRYVVTQGMSCTPFGVSSIGDAAATDLLLRGYVHVMDSCYGCACDAVPPEVTQEVLLSPGGTYPLVWDARTSVGCLIPNTGCPDRVHPVSVLQPVPAGEYRITVKLNLSPPLCDGGPVDCTVAGMMPCGVIQVRVPIGQLGLGRLHAARLG